VAKQGSSQKSSKGQHKANRNRDKPSCKRYLAEQRWVKNAERRRVRHLKRMAKQRTKVRAKAG
jgi:hypothetical protein